MDTSPVVPFLSEYGQFRLVSFRTDGGKVHLAMWMGELGFGDPLLLRIQSACTTGTALGGAVCDCAPQLRSCLSAIAEEGRGMVIYMDDEARGHGLHEKLKGMAEMMLNDADTVAAYTSRGLPADRRTYADVGPMLRRLETTTELRLLTNNPHKVTAVEEQGFKVTERLPVEVAPTDATYRYLATKKHKLGHIISTVE
jgi:3,4-dihydroxy 2-butanone 4-phosphate synthase/GTP cyclohydrolase II